MSNHRNGIRQKISRLVSGITPTQDSDFLNFMGGTRRQLLTSPQSEQSSIVTDVIFSKLNGNDIESLEK
jgi:hypothetical protein